MIINYYFETDWSEVEYEYDADITLEIIKEYIYETYPNVKKTEDTDLLIKSLYADEFIENLIYSDDFNDWVKDYFEDDAWEEYQDTKDDLEDLIREDDRSRI